MGISLLSQKCRQNRLDSINKLAGMHHSWWHSQWYVSCMSEMYMYVLYSTRINKHFQIKSNISICITRTEYTLFVQDPTVFYIFNLLLLWRMKLALCSRTCRKGNLLLLWKMKLAWCTRTCQKHELWQLICVIKCQMNDDRGYTIQICNTSLGIMCVFVGGVGDQADCVAWEHSFSHEDKMGTPKTFWSHKQGQWILMPPEITWSKDLAIPPKNVDDPLSVWYINWVKLITGFFL